jgi:hypothetical protein
VCVASILYDRTARAAIGKSEVGVVTVRARQSVVSREQRIEEQVAAEIDLLRAEAIAQRRQSDS